MTFGLFRKGPFWVKNTMATVSGNFGKNWTTFYFKIWSPGFN